MAYYNENRRDESGRFGRHDWDRTRENFRERFTAARDDDDDDDENYWDDNDGYGIRARGYQSSGSQASYGGRDDMRDRRYSRSGADYDRDEGSRRSSWEGGRGGSYTGPGYSSTSQQYGPRGSQLFEAGQSERGGYGYGGSRGSGYGSAGVGGYGGSAYGGYSRSSYGASGHNQGYGGSSTSSYGAGSRQSGTTGGSYFTGQQRGWAEPSMVGDRSGSRYGADYRGRDYAGNASGAYGSGNGWRARDHGTRDFSERGGGYAEHEDRGFFERAGDEVASWFGDEEAARRREMDHRGRGPSDYRRSDERIQEDANDRLTDDPRVDARHITVSVSNGEITLSGTVRDRDSKRRAEDCVEDISGVRHVQNNLRVEDKRMTGSTMPNTATTSSGTGSAMGSSTGTYGSMSGTSSPNATATGASSTSATNGATMTGNGGATGAANKSTGTTGGKANPAT